MWVGTVEGDWKGPELESHAAPRQGDTSLGKASTGLTFTLTRLQSNQKKQIERKKEEEEGKEGA